MPMLLLKNLSAKKMIKKISVVGIALLFLSSCMMKPMGGGGRISKYAQSYFKGEGKTLYYIKPVPLKHNKELLEADFTFNKGDTAIKSVFINLSMHGNPPFSKADSAQISFGTNAYTAKNVKLIYNENVKRKKYSRQSIDMPNEYFELLLKEKTFYITLYTNAQAKKYSSGKQWRKTHEKLYAMMFW